MTDNNFDNVNPDRAVDHHEEDVPVYNPTEQTISGGDGSFPITAEDAADAHETAEQQQDDVATEQREEAYQLEADAAALRAEHVNAEQKARANYPVTDQQAQYQQPSVEAQPTTAIPVVAGGNQVQQQPVLHNGQPADPWAGYEESKPQATIEIKTRRGTLDFGLLISRVALGAYLVFHSLLVFFFSEHAGINGLNGLEKHLEELGAGHQMASIFATLLPGLELAAGIFLILGLLTPLFAAIATAVTGFELFHQIWIADSSRDPLTWGSDVFLPVFLFVIAVSLLFTGPGLFGFDFARPWAKRPLISPWIFLLIGLAGAVALWWFGTGINPFA